MKKLEKFADREISSEIQRKIKGGDWACCDSYATSYCNSCCKDTFYSCYYDIMNWCSYIPSAFGC